MSNKDKKLLRKYAFLLLTTSYRRLYLTYLGMRKAYFEKVLKRDIDFVFTYDADFDYANSMYKSVSKENANIDNLIIIYALTCKAYAERINKYGVFVL